MYPRDPVLQQEVTVCVTIALTSFVESIMKVSLSKDCTRQRSIRRVEVAGHNNRSLFLVDIPT